MTQSGTRKKGSSMKQENKNGVRRLYARDERIMVTWGQISMRQGMQRRRMKQGEQGQTEGCQRCDGNRTDLMLEKVWWRRSGVGWTLSEIHQ